MAVFLLTYRLIHYIMFTSDIQEEKRMEDYTKLYHLLFNAITDALEQMNAQNFGSAKETLVSAQQKAEEIYITAEN